MALKLSITTEHGIDLPDAYARIDEQSGNKIEVTVRLRYYASQPLALEGKSWIEEKIISFVPSVEEGSANFIEQGYLYIKTLPEFSEAIDV